MAILALLSTIGGNTLQLGLWRAPTARAHSSEARAFSPPRVRTTAALEHQQVPPRKDVLHSPHAHLRRQSPEPRAAYRLEPDRQASAFLGACAWAELGTQCLEKCRNSNGFLYGHRDIANAELYGVKERMNP